MERSIRYVPYEDVPFCDTVGNMPKRQKTPEPAMKQAPAGLLSFEGDQGVITVAYEGGRASFGGDPERFVIHWTRTGDGRLHSIQYAEVNRAVWAVETLWEEDQGRFEPTAVTVRSHLQSGGAPVTAEVLRRLPIGTLHKVARKHASEQTDHCPSNPDRVESSALIDELSRIGPSRGSKLTDDELAQVAAVYLDAWRRGDEVTVAVKDHFHIARSTAAKRIMKARAAGYLDNIDGRKKP